MVVLEHKVGLTTDMQRSTHPLKKIQCVTCGLVRSENTLFLESFYEEDYRKEESDVITSVLSGNQAVAFSSLMEDWLKNLIPDTLSTACSMLEIGCGDGRLLHRFGVPRKVGLEPSRYLFELAKRNCSECALENIAIEHYETDEKFDVIISINVFEHLPDPVSFLKKLASLLTYNGAAVLVFPTQEQFNYDVCFIDHLFHMRLGHLAYLAEKCGLTVIRQDVGFQSYQVANGVVLKKKPSHTENATRLVYLENENPRLMADIFKKFKEKILEFDGKERIVAFGHGELCKVFAAYGEVFDRIEYFIDDFYSGNDKHVMSLNRALELGILDNACLIFLVNPSYRDYMLDKLQAAQSLAHIYFPTSMETMTLKETS